MTTIGTAGEASQETIAVGVGPDLTHCALRPADQTCEESHKTNDYQITTVGFVLDLYIKAEWNKFNDPTFKLTTEIPIWKILFISQNTKPLGWSP